MVKKLDYFIFISLIFIFIITFVSVMFYAYFQEESCQLNPLVYGASKYKESSNADLIFGEIVLVKQNSLPLRIYFNEKKETREGEQVPSLLKNHTGWLLFFSKRLVKNHFHQTFPFF